MLALSVLLVTLAVQPDDAAANSKTAFNAGKALYEQGKYADALARFEQAQQARPHPVITFNIAKCLEQLGQTARALRQYREYLKQAPDSTEAPRVNSSISRLERRLAASGVQQLLIWSEPPAARVEVDGKDLGPTPTSVELASGSHRLKVSSEGFSTEERSFSMSIERASEMTITLKEVAPLKRPADAPLAQAPPEPAPAPAGLTAAQPTSSSARSHVGTFVAGGVAAAALAVGIGLGVAASTASTTLHSSVHSTPDVDALISHGQAMATGANVAYGVAATAAVVAVVLFFVEGR